jgi:excisionase family DNA binding protein
MLTVAQAAKRLERSPRRVRALLESGQLKGRKVGRDWVVSEAAVRAYAAKEHPVGRLVGWRKPKPTPEDAS